MTPEMANTEEDDDSSDQYTIKHSGVGITIMNTTQGHPLTANVSPDSGPRKYSTSIVERNTSAGRGQPPLKSVNYFNVPPERGSKVKGTSTSELVCTKGAAAVQVLQVLHVTRSDQ